jgi:hypothetical protein
METNLILHQLLIVHGTADRVSMILIPAKHHHLTKTQVTSHKASEEFVGKISSKDKTYTPFTVRSALFVIFQHLTNETVAGRIPRTSE